MDERRLREIIYAMLELLAPFVAAGLLDELPSDENLLLARFYRQEIDLASRFGLPPHEAGMLIMHYGRALQQLPHVNELAPLLAAYLAEPLRPGAYDQLAQELAQAVFEHMAKEPYNEHVQSFLAHLLAAEGVLEARRAATGGMGAIIEKGIDTPEDATLGVSEDALPTYEQRSLEAAMPQQCLLGMATELRCMLAVAGSKGLKQFLPARTTAGDLIRRSDVQNKAVELELQPGELATLVYLELQGPGWQIDEPQQRIKVRRGVDSGVISFLLTPQLAHPRSRVMLRLYQDPQYETLLDTLILICAVVQPGGDEPLASEWVYAAQKVTGLPVAVVETDEVTTLSQRLASHRATLAHYLQRRSLMGEAHAPPEVSAGIRSERLSIQRIKEYLRNKGQNVADAFDDEE
jgi:hypothetical protein